MSSQYKKTIVIGMDYSEFSSGITDINRKMGLLDAEFKRATAEVDVYGDSTEKLEVQQEMLTQKLELQKKKVDETAKVYDKIVKAHGYESKAADQADKSLLNERTTLLKLEKQLKDTKDRIVATADESSGFTDEVTSLNDEMSLLSARLKNATTQAELHGDASETLRLKQDSLRKQIDLQSQKVELLADRYEDIVAVHGNASKAASDAEKEFLNERTALTKLESQLKDTENQIEDTSEKNRTFGDTLRDVADFIGIKANPMVDKLAEKFDGVDEKVGQAILTVGTLVTTLGSLTMKTAENAREISNVSQRMGMTTDQYQEWDYIMKQVGSDAENMTGDIARLAERAVQATNKTSETAKMFRLLGVNVRDSHGAMKSQNELFSDVIRGLQKMEDETKRNAIASKLLSTTGEKLGPVLNMTTQEIQGLKNEAHAMGYVIDSDGIAKFEQLNKAMKEVKTMGNGVANSFAEALLPMLTALFSAISSIPTPVLTMIITLTGMIATMVAIGKAIESTVGVFSGFSKFLTGFNLKGNQTALVIMGIVSALALLAVAIAAITGKTGDIDRTMQSINNVTRGTQLQHGKTQYYASGTDFAPGGKAWVGENGPELLELPRGSRVLSADDSKRTAGGDTYILQANIDAKNIKDWTDVVNFMQQGKQAARAGRSRL